MLLWIATSGPLILLPSPVFGLESLGTALPTSSGSEAHATALNPVLLAD